MGIVLREPPLHCAHRLFSLLSSQVALFKACVKALYCVSWGLKRECYQSLEPLDNMLTGNILAPNDVIYCFSCLFYLR